jgi:hypothetical protein
MFIPEDVFENSSDALSAVIAEVLSDDEVAQPATLASVREAVLAEVETVTIPLNRFSSEQRQALQDEVDALIEEYGEDSLAVRFQKPWASEPLRLLIEAGLDELGEPTLGGLFEAAEQGLLANLIGEGAIDDDEAQTVIAELQGLIERHGNEALAEDFLGSP